MTPSAATIIIGCASVVDLKGRSIAGKDRVQRPGGLEALEGRH